MKTSRLLAAAVLSTSLLLAFAPATRAAIVVPDLGYFVTLNLSSLVGNGNSPFSLDFQLVDGSGNISNTVTLSNFSFTGGTPSGTPNFTAGGESGALAIGSSIVLTNSSTNNEFAEAFSSGMTQISFRVDETPNSETSNTGTPSPEQFNIYVDDGTGYSIPTTDPSGNGLLLSSDLGATAKFASVETFSSVSPDAGVSVTIAAPEPSTGMLSLIATGAMIGFLLMRRRRVT